MHPALPAYLSDQWRADDPNVYAAQREAANRALLDAYAAFGLWAAGEITGGHATLAYSRIELHRRTLDDLLGYALDRGHWDKARSIFEALDSFWNARVLYREASEWVARVRQVLEPATGTPPSLDDPAGILWMSCVGAQAQRQINVGLLDSAEYSLLQIHDVLAALPERDPRRRSLAAIYYGFGQIAKGRGLLEVAENWYQKSLTIDGELDRSGAADSYHHLGMIAIDRGQLDEAETWHHKSRTIRKKLNDLPGIAASYHELGLIAQYRGQLERAEAWHHRSLTIKKAIGEQTGQATSYLQLGVLALQRGHLDEAEAWHHRSLAISEKLGIQAVTANCYRAFGLITQLRGQLDRAEAWQHRALAVSAQLGDRSGQARSFELLGRLARIRGRDEEMMEWTVRWVTLFDEFPHPATEFAALVLARATAVMGVNVLQRCWLKMTGKPVPAEVLSYVEANKPKESE